MVIPECWIDRSTQGAKPMRTVEDLAHSVRTARNSVDCKKAMFDLAFYMRFTKAVRASDFTARDWADVVLWAVDKEVDVSPKFTKPQW